MNGDVSTVTALEVRPQNPGDVEDVKVVLLSTALAHLVPSHHDAAAPHRQAEPVLPGARGVHARLADEPGEDGV